MGQTRVLHLQNTRYFITQENQKVAQMQILTICDFFKSPILG